LWNPIDEKLDPLDDLMHHQIDLIRYITNKEIKYLKILDKNSINLILYDESCFNLISEHRSEFKEELEIKGDKKLISTYEIAQSLRDHLATGKPVSTHSQFESKVFMDLCREMRFLTAKPVIFAVNVDETGLADETPEVTMVREIAGHTSAEVIILCAKLEEEMLDMTPEEQQEFLELAGAEQSGLDQIVRKGFDALGLISYFTKNEKESRMYLRVYPKEKWFIAEELSLGELPDKTLAYARKSGTHGSTILCFPRTAFNIDGIYNYLTQVCQFFSEYQRMVIFRSSAD